MRSLTRRPRNGTQWKTLLRLQHERRGERYVTQVIQRRLPLAPAAPPLPLQAAADPLTCALREPLWPHQEQAVRWMAQREASLAEPKGGLLCDDMRLGKTRQAWAFELSDLQRRLRAARAAAPRHSGAPTMIVMPNSLLGTWLGEYYCLFGSAGPLHVAVACNSEARQALVDAAASPEEASFLRQRVRWLPTQVTAHGLAAHTDVVLTTYHTLLAAKRSLSGRFTALLQLHWRRVVADEGHLFCGGGKTAAWFQVMHGLRADAKWLLTATPVQNHAHELHRALQFVGVPGVTANMPHKQVRQLAKPLTLRRERATIEAGQDATIKDVLLDFATPAERALMATHEASLRQRKLRVADCTRLRQHCLCPALLPAAQLDTLLATAGLSTQAPRTPDDALAQARRYPVLAAHYLAMLAGPAAVPTELAEAALRASVAADVLPLVMTKEQYVLDFLRLEVEPRGEKLVVFSSFVSELKRLHGFLEARARILGPAGCAVLVHGDLSEAEREQNKAKFRRDPRVTCLLITTNVGGLGLDLTVANHGVLLDSWWNPYRESQAVSRLAGPMQRRPLDLRRLVLANTFEARVMEVADRKRSLMPDMVATDEHVHVQGGGGGEEDEEGGEAMDLQHVLQMYLQGGGHE